MNKAVKSALLSAAPWLVTLVFSGGAVPAVADGHSERCLAPSGGDDTAALQAALDRCSGARRECSVALCHGVFRTGILRVRDFRGTLRGAGARETVLRALPELPVSDRPGFFRDDPFDATWPYLVQFFEGAARIRDLGLSVPTPPEGSRPTTGWSLFEGEEPTFELRGAMLLSGRGPVDFEVRDVRVVAEPDPASDLATTTFNGVEFGGLLHDPSAPEPFPVFPLRGRYRVTDSALEGVLSGTPLAEISGADVRVEGNRYRSTIAVDVIDADRSQVAILGNRWTVSYRGVQMLQNLDGSPSRESAFRVEANVGRLVPLSAGVGDGLFFQDPIDASPEPGGTTLRAAGNRWRLGDATRPAASGITTNGAARLRLLDNRLSGAAGTGLDVTATEGCRIQDNSLGRLDTSPGPDLRLGSATSDCLALVSSHDVVVDEGTDNSIVRQ
jgi:hypothetical protein